jgi:hypothetical protein
MDLLQLVQPHEGQRLYWQEQDHIVPVHAAIPIVVSRILDRRVMTMQDDLGEPALTCVLIGELKPNQVGRELGDQVTAQHGLKGLILKRAD